MYFNYHGRGANSWIGAHCVMGKTYLDDEYYFAEGTTRAGFESWITIQNPEDRACFLQADYQLGPGQGGPITKDYMVPAGTRYTIFLQDEVGPEKDVSVRLKSQSSGTYSNNFLAERAMYFNYQHGEVNSQGGHCVIGATSTADDWYLAEGYTGTGFDEWLCIQNPNPEAADIGVMYYCQETGPIGKTHRIEGFS